MVFIYFPDIQRVSFKKYGLKLLSHTVPLSKTASLRRNYRHLGDGKAATATLFVPTRVSQNRHREDKRLH